MSILRPLAAACLAVCPLFAQLTESCTFGNTGTIPPASVGGHGCDPRRNSPPPIESISNATQTEIRPQTSSVSFHQLSHEVPKKARKEFLSAERAKEDGDLKDAIGHYHKALAIDPEYLEAWNNLGSAHIQLSDLPSAETALDKAYAIDPTAGPVLSNLAFVHLSTRRPVTAEPLARKAMQADPLAPKPRYLLGIALAQQSKDKLEAIRLLISSCEAFPRAHFALGPLLTEVGQLPEAAQHLKAYLAASNHPDRAMARDWLKQIESKIRKH